MSARLTSQPHQLDDLLGLLMTAVPLDGPLKRLNVTNALIAILPKVIKVPVYSCKRGQNPLNETNEIHLINHFSDRT